MHEYHAAAAAEIIGLLESDARRIAVSYVPGTGAHILMQGVLSAPKVRSLLSQGVERPVNLLFIGANAALAEYFQQDLKIPFINAVAVGFRSRLKADQIKKWDAIIAINADRYNVDAALKGLGVADDSTPVITVEPKFTLPLGSGIVVEKVSD